MSSLRFGGLSISQGLTIPFDQLSEDKQKEHIDKCESEQCKQAKINLENIRNEHNSLCSQAKAKTAKAWAYLAAAVALIALALAFAEAAKIASATIIGIPVAIGLFAVAAVFLTTAVWSITLAMVNFAKAANLRSQANKKSQEFTDAANEVRIACSEYCLPDDMTAPVCS